MRLRNRFAVLGLSAILLGSTVACTTTGSTTTFNTAALNKDASAIAYAVQVIETMPGLVDHLSADDKAKFDNLVSQIKSVTASIEASSDGSITVNTGKDWAKSLGTDLNTLLTIAAPIVAIYYPSASTYLSTVQAMIPLVETLAGVGVERNQTALESGYVAGGSRLTGDGAYLAPGSSNVRISISRPEDIRARIYQGV